MKLNRFKRFILGIHDDIFTAEEMRANELIAYKRGVSQAKIKFAILPLPLTAGELEGRAYGSFITPPGFGFPECSVPAPGPHGYEQRAYYVSRDALDRDNALTLACHAGRVFNDPANNDKLVPVIVTVLR